MENMPLIKRYLGHLHTINTHKREVMRLCFKVGLYNQGLLHDLSKFSPVEFLSGVKYYQGYRSPINREREIIGYSLGWQHHSGRNKHHFEYWVDKDYDNLSYYVIDMPFNYILEACLDKIAASKTYNKSNYNDAKPYDFLVHGKDKNMMGKNNFRRHKELLEYLKDNGEEKALQYYKELYKKWKKDKNFNI